MDERTSRPTPEVEITLLGSFEVTVDGVPTSTSGWARRSAAGLVKVLALAPHRRLHREHVIDLLWPDRAPGRGLASLHKAAHFARRAAGHDGAVVLRDEMVSLFPGAKVMVDVTLFEEAARRAVAHSDAGLAQGALAWYGGELLPGDRYEDWAADRRELLRLRHLDVLRVAGHWRELSEADPTDEDAHVRLMHGLVRAGHADAAILQYERLERVLDRELGVAPSEAARRIRLDAVSSPARTLLAELAELRRRERAVLANLAACRASGVGITGGASV